ncbi:MAG: bifunctional riboflavin kinase/FAD synthetase [Candidatus Omnitrophica bacterium]|nr:bifunctional riboflavin kinase/FAD synthetase [Candidatus Omnitrophota bacterium]
MKRVNGIRNLRSKVRKPVLAVGVFDGVHRGHQRIIREVVREAKRIGGTSVIMTFDPHPLKLLYRKAHAPLITSLEHRINLIGDLDVDICLVINFNNKFSRISADDFIKKVLLQALGIECLVIGESFRFGRKKRGSLALLRELSREHKFHIHKVKPFKVNGKIISSSKIRQFIKNGELSRAKVFLGREFSILGRVVPGRARGRILGFPTANITPHQEIVPLSGVYAVRVKLNKRVLPGILNIGKRPTFENKKDAYPTIETHIFNFHNNIYGKKLEIFFVKRIRPEKRFYSPEALRAQIARDQHKAKSILK